MSYSRRQLYAMGEPLGDSATYRKVDGGLVLGGGGGGGGSAPANTTSTTTQTAELPEWARGYAKDTLAKGQALTDINQNPYQAYSGDRIAGFSPMQQQAMQGAQNMQPAQQLNTGSGLATAAGVGGLNAQYGGEQFGNTYQGIPLYNSGRFNQQRVGTQQFTGDQVGQYMNPYLQNALDPQLQEIQRQYGITGAQQQSAATQAGAFGGSREAIMAAENERNKNTAMNQAIGQGFNTAYGNAQNQFNQSQQQALQAQQANQQTNLATQQAQQQANQFGYGQLANQAQNYAQYGQAANQLNAQQQQFGANLGLQGLQQANQAATTLGQLGQNQYQQNMGINQLQAQYGGQQQALQQQGLTQAYTDFQNQQNYPYKQLGFMSDMIRGLPLGQQSTAAVYQPPPSALQTMGALGLGAYGAKQLGMFAEGGEVKTYAGDKESVTSSDNIEEIISTLNPEQLQQARQTALARRDTPTVEAIDARLAELASEASMTQGIAGALPNQMADGIVNAAGGGILAFNGEDEQTGQLIGYSRGNPAYYQKGLSGLYDIAGKIGDFEGESYTPEQQQALTQRYYRNEQNIAGPSPYIDLEADQEQRRSDRLQGLKEGKGAIAFKGIQALLQGGNAIRGFGNLAGTVGDEAIKMKTADRAEKRAIASMDFNIKKAKRDESLGMYKSAAGSTQKAIEDQRERNKQSLKQLEVQKGAFSDLAKASKETGRAGTGAGGANKPEKIWERLATATTDLNALANKLGPDFASKPEYIAKKKDVEALGAIAEKSKDIQPIKAGQVDTAQADKRTAAEAAAWSQTYKGRQAQKSYAIANGIKTGTGNPSWREEAREHHRKNFGKTAPAGGSTVINFDANGQPIQ